jgi:NAD-dependent deacetylase
MHTALRTTLGRADLGAVVVLTGAGISAESGIPTFRGPEGYWTVGSRVYRPQELATRAAFERMPWAIWQWYLHRRRICRAAPVNPGHLALCRLERQLGSRFCLITQNVDGLHLRAGNSPERTYQVHGNIDHMRCAGRCSDAPWPVPEELDPASAHPGEPEPAPGDRPEQAFPEPLRAQLSCRRCGGLTRPHVLWFDEYYEEALFRSDSALAAARRATLLVTIGSSGSTNLPWQVATAAARAGALLVDINPADNPFAELARRSGGHREAAAATSALPVLAEVLGATA